MKIRSLQKFNIICIFALALLLAVFCIFEFSYSHSAFAADSPDVSSAVLHDLHLDKRFDESDYPVIAKDYSLHVIGITESIDDELFVYVYQPSGKVVDLRATSINISKGYKTLDFKNYTLSFCNSYNTLYKYKVDDFKIDDMRLRYYDITSIYRAWNKNYGDIETGNDNTVSEVAYNVSRIFKFGVENGEFVVDSVPTDTIQVVSKYVGFVRYVGGFLWETDACDSHFVAFSTNIPIDELREADIYYRQQSYVYDTSTYKYHTYGEIESKYSYVKDTQEVQYESTGFWNVGKICRDRIQTVDDFLVSENFENVYSYGLFNTETQSKISEEGKKNLKDCAWVIRFAETPYFYSSQSSPPYITRKTYCIVSDVSILRLEGISDGKTFNFGVIDNKQSGSGNPVNEVGVSVDFDPLIEFLEKALLIIAVILLFIVLGQFITPIGNIMKLIFKSIVFVITLPFRLLKALFKTRK